MTSVRPDATKIDGAVLHRLLLTHYGLDAASIVRMKSVCGIRTNGGDRYIWKSVGQNHPERRLEILDLVVRELSRYGLTAAGPLRNSGGSFLTPAGNSEYGYLQPWLSGRHLNPRDEQERLSGAATLGAMHRITACLPDIQLEPGRTPLEQKLGMKRNLLTQVWPEMRAQMPELVHSEEALFTQTNNAMAVLYAHPCRVRQFCHRDVAPHNLLWQVSHAVQLIDFDLAGMDDPFVDIVQFANHCVFLGEPRPGFFLRILDAYEHNAPLERARRQVLQKLLQFPDVLIRSAAEWVKSGWAREQQVRVQAALYKEQLRRTAWTADFGPDRY